MHRIGAKPKSLHFDAACLGGANIYYNVSDGKMGGPQLTSDIANPTVIDPEIVEMLDEDNRLTRDYVDRVLDAVEDGLRQVDRGERARLDRRARVLNREEGGVSLGHGRHRIPRVLFACRRP